MDFWVIRIVGPWHAVSRRRLDPDPVCSCEHGGKVRVCTRAAAGRVEGRSDRSRLVQ